MWVVEKEYDLHEGERAGRAICREMQVSRSDEGDNYRFFEVPDCCIFIISTKKTIISHHLRTYQLN